MILTDLFESPEIHNQDRLDSILGRCIELIHEKNGAYPKKYGRVAACIIDMKNRKVFGINSPGPNGRRRHAERMAIDAYHKRYGKILPGAIIVTTLSPCNRPMAERDGPSCQDLLMQAGIEKVYSGYMDPSQHSDHPFTEEVTQNDDLWRRCKEFSDSFVHDDLTEGLEQTPVIIYTDHRGATIDDGIKNSLRVTQIPVDKLRLWEKHKSMQDPKVADWVTNKLLPELKQNGKLKPLLVWNNNGQFFVIDGNHRLIAYQEAGYKGNVPVQLVPDNMITVSDTVPGQQGVAEDTQLPGDFKLMGQNLFLKNLARNLKQRYPDATVKLLNDRVTAYHNKEDDEALTVMGTEVMDSGYIGVGLDDAFTESFQGVLVPTIKQTTEQLLAANPGTKPALFLSTDNWNPDAWTHIATKLGYRLVADDESLDEQGVAEGLEQTPDQVRQTLNAWMNQDQQYEDPSQRAGFQAKVWPYIQQNIKTILADKGEKGNGDYPAAPYAAWLLVQHMDAYPQNQIEFYNALKQAIPNHPKIQFLRDRAAVNQWIMKNANNPEYFIKGEALPNPTVNVRNPDRFKDAGIVATSREEALANAEQAGNKLLVAAVNATNAQTQPSYKQSANENFADGKNPGRKGLAKRSGVNTKASVSTLRNVAKHSTGEKQRMAHWLANMKAGRAKARRK